MPIPSCPPEIAALMTVTVLWETFRGFDGHAEPSYGPAIELSCWQEPHGLTSGGGAALRLADGTTVEPQVELFFSGDDPNALRIQLYDRFTPTGVAIVDQSLQAVRVTTLYGPPFDNQNPWLIQVTL